jgi:4a-hydroxytetrahydrobiopterin dehydratase
MDIPDGWSMADSGEALLRNFTFQDFSEAFAFLTRVAMHAEKVDHHPDFCMRWNRLEFRLTTHDAGRATERDAKLAEAIGLLAGDR